MPLPRCPRESLCGAKKRMRSPPPQDLGNQHFRVKTQARYVHRFPWCLGCCNRIRGLWFVNHGILLGSGGRIPTSKCRQMEQPAFPGPQPGASCRAPRMWGGEPYTPRGGEGCHAPGWRRGAPCPPCGGGGRCSPTYGWRRGAAHSPGASHQLTRRTHDGGTLMTPPVTSQRPHLQIPAP